MSKFGLNTGALQLLPDINKEKLEGKSQTFNLQIQQWYKNMKTYLRFTGSLKFDIATAPSSDTTYDLGGTFKSDHFYNIVNSLVFRLNSNYEVRNYTRLSAVRQFNLICSEGYRSFEKLPKSVTIKANQTSALVDFDFIVPIHFTIQDMQGRTSAFIATWLYNAIQLTLTNGDIGDIFDLEKLSTKHEGLSVSINERFIESTSCYWITGAGVFEADSVQGVLSQMGGAYRVTSFMTPVYMGSKDFVIDQFTPTTNVNLTGFLIITRDPDTGERVGEVFDRLRFVDGSRPLFECDPEFLKQFVKEKYNFSNELYEKEDATELDGQGALYGVIKVDTTFWGEMSNSMLAVGNWQKPKLYVNMKSQAQSGYTKDRVNVEIYQFFYEVPQMSQKQALDYVKVNQGV